MSELSLWNFTSAFQAYATSSRDWWIRASRLATKTIIIMIIHYNFSQLLHRISNVTWIFLNTAVVCRCETLTLMMFVWSIPFKMMIAFELISKTLMVFSLSKASSEFITIMSLCVSCAEWARIIKRYLNNELKRYVYCFTWAQFTYKIYFQINGY